MYLFLEGNGRHLYMYESSLHDDPDTSLPVDEVRAPDDIEPDLVWTG